MDPDDPHDGSDAVELLTYAELSSRRGISRASAERLARRRKWKRVIGNDGVARVAVPPDAATLAPDDPLDIRGLRADPVPALRAAVDTLRDQLKREGDRADRAEARADKAEATIAGQASLIAAAEVRTREAEERLRTLERANEHRRRQGRWGRLRAAWRGG